ncbi:Hsp33 family molecular chaperone HslO, partial [Chitinimonas sp.]|uniref:Hsp33 family molecular chaperone HslO n=1 Tax=Chitinimonas sp. TaxID=1934313 RepID=UPI0035AF4AB4
EEHPHFGCRCSRDKVGNMIKMLGKPEADSIVAEFGGVDIHCDFCNQHYRFDVVDVGQLFAIDSTETPSETRH